MTKSVINNLLESTCLQIDSTLDTDQLEQIAHFCQLLATYNAHTNLVANAEFEVVLRDHVMDSLSLVPTIISRPVAKEKTNRLIDIGSGAGFPGLILAIASRHLSVTLVESVGKKARFLEDTVSKIALSQRVEVKQARAEELAHQAQYRGKFDLATGRALGSLAVVAELTVPFLSVGGVCLLQKTVKQSEEEAPKARANLQKLGARLIKTIVLDAEILGKERAVMLIEQIKPVIARYPRPWAQIKQAPLF
jgi:16S rRNA (guanine527-N7)-methyltransferase